MWPSGIGQDGRDWGIIMILNQDVRLIAKASKQIAADALDGHRLPKEGDVITIFGTADTVVVDEEVMMSVNSRLETAADTWGQAIETYGPWN